MTLRGVILIACLAFTGCGAEQKFVRTGIPVPTTPKQMDSVIVFSNPSQVPWPYEEIGELIPNKTPRRFQTPQVQIDDIKREAAKNGADGVILHRDVGQRGNLIVDRGTGFGNSQSILMFSGTAIVKKEQVVSSPTAK